MQCVTMYLNIGFSIQECVSDHAGLIIEEVFVNHLGPVIVFDKIYLKKILFTNMGRNEFS